MTVKPKRVRVEDNDFQHVQVLKTNRYKRHRYQEFCVEGVRPINSALANKWEFTGLYYAEGRELSDWARGILKSADTAQHYELAPQLMEKISEKEETSELIATVKMRPNDLGRIKLHERLLCVILDRPNSPGNLGTSVRSCDAFGVDGVIVTGHAADIYHPQAVRGSVGALFAQTVVRNATMEDLIMWFERIGTEFGSVQVIGSSAKAERTLGELEIEGPTIVIAGNETLGMSAAFRELCDTTISIPQCGTVSSLNVSCALSIILYEVSRKKVR